MPQRHSQRATLPRSNRRAVQRASSVVPPRGHYDPIQNLVKNGIDFAKMSLTNCESDSVVLGAVLYLRSISAARRERVCLSPIALSDNHESPCTVLLQADTNCGSVRCNNALDIISDLNDRIVQA